MSQSTSSTSQAPYHAEGVNESERYLNKLARKTFLSLWSYPGIYRNQGSGKEICDLLIVFDNHIIIFSDKDCEFPDTGNIDVDWKRWYKKAILKSAKQVWGAERWIKEHPDRIFLDPACTQPFPLQLPSPDKAIFHRIVVAHGAVERCKKFFGGGSGSLMLDTHLVGDDHFENYVFPFTVGKIDAQKGFVHVLDDASLDIVLKTLDTITDFVMYLTKKENFLSGDIEISVTGEEDLLGFYLKDLNNEGERDFVLPNGLELSHVVIVEGEWLSFINSPERKAQVEANKISYAWDDLIETFNKHLIEGTRYLYSHEKREDVEVAHRFLAREPRTRRRLLAENLFDVIENNEKNISVRYSNSISSEEPAYVFLALANPYNFPYEQYRAVRAYLLEICCKVFRLEYRHLTDIIGIATELGIDSPSRSEDLLYFDARLWTEEDEKEAREVQQELGLLNQPYIKFTRRLYHEYPVTHVQQVAIPREIGRNDLCYCGSGKKYKQCCRRREYGQHRRK